MNIRTVWIATWVAASLMTFCFNFFSKIAARSGAFAPSMIAAGLAKRLRCTPTPVPASCITHATPAPDPRPGVTIRLRTGKLFTKDQHGSDGRASEQQGGHGCFAGGLLLHSNASQIDGIGATSSANRDGC